MTPTITTVSESFEGKTISCAQIVCSDPCSYKFSKIVSADDDYQFQGVFKSTANKTLTIQVGDSVQTLDITSTFTRYVLSFHNVTIVDNDSVYVTFPAGTYYLYNLQLERGSTPTKWQPAPEDAIDVVPVSAEAQTTIFNLLTQNGTAQGIFLQDGKLYINGEYIQANTINADKIHGGTLSGAEINIGNGTFTVDGNGKVEASNMNITGGAVNITTNTEEKSVISLSYGDATLTKIAPFSNIIQGRHNARLYQTNLYPYATITTSAGSSNVPKRMYALGDNGGGQGNASLELYDKEGQKRVSADADTSQVMLQNASGIATGRFWNLTSGGVLYLYDSSGTQRIGVDISGFKIYDSNGTKRVDLSSSGLVFYNSSGTVTKTYSST